MKDGRGLGDGFWEGDWQYLINDQGSNVESHNIYE